MLIVRSPENQEEFEKYFALRYKILRQKWNQPRGSERDELEDSSIHIMALENDLVIGCCRLQFNSTEEAQIRYMAVEEGWQGKGIGRLMLLEAEKKAREKGARYIMLEARENAVEFYKQNDYTVTKESYLLFDVIQHYTMIKNI
jgi:predicted GNAT family N-acyltransferase